MRYRYGGRIVGTGCALLGLACTSTPATTFPGIDVPPIVRTSIAAQPAWAGTPFAFDATLRDSAFLDLRGGGLRYAVTFSPAGNGLTATGGRISGVPLTPGIVSAKITAIDVRDDTASQTFRIVIFAASLTTPTLPASTYGYSDVRVPLPQHFILSGTGSALATDNTPSDNRTTDDGATLGRVLFYDQRLSVNDRVACGSCHQQQFGFADTARFGRGINGALTPRRTMSLANTRFYQTGRFFWDERAATLEEQTLQPIQNLGEMGMTLEDLVLKLQLTSYYPQLFQSAFGTTEITADRVSRALAQFVRSLTSWQARSDTVFMGGGPPNFAMLTAEEQQGALLFNGSAGCSVCHRTDAMIVDQVRNTGLDAISTDPGAGQGRFKAPSLKNIAIRPPYMHDGRFRTLREVVDFYDHGIQPNPMLDVRLRGADGTPKRLNLSVVQRDAIVAYMQLFTDQGFLHAPRFANPF